MYRENKLKKMMQGGGRALGCWTSLENVMTTEILAVAGFDFLLIDHEHGFGDPTGLVGQLQAMTATPATSVVRIPNADEAYAKKVLDAGAECLMVPGVETADEAREIVDFCRYSPLGRRGMAPGMIRATNFGFDAPNYVKTAADNLLLICQIETASAVENIAEIGAVDGVDMLFIGPNDLSCSIDKFAQYEDPEFTALMAKAEKAILATGKLMGTIPYGGRGWRDLFEAGYAMTTASSEVALLRDAAANVVAQHRSNMDAI